MTATTSNLPLFDRWGLVRPLGQEPPLSELFILNVGGIRFSSSCLLHSAIIVFFHVYGFRHWHLFPGFVMYMIAVQAMSILDTQISNGFSNNIRNLRKAGFSDLQTLCFTEYNRVSSQMIGYVIMNYIILPSDSENDNVFTWANLFQFVTLPQNWAKVGLNLLLTEFLFFCGHGLMHVSPTFLQWHVFHHCCTTPTFLTNLMFHPLDLKIEFAGPALGLLAMHYLVWNQDLSVLLYTYLIFQLWYAYDHDETMQLYHLKHHQYCDSLYVIYSNYKSQPGNNMLKSILQTDYGVDLGPSTEKKRASSFSQPRQSVAEPFHSKEQ